MTLLDNILENCIACISRGSIIYGSWHNGSDVDMYCIMPDSIDLSLYGKVDEFGQVHAEIDFHEDLFTITTLDIEFLHESKYVHGLNEGNVAFLELIWQKEMDYDIRYKEFHKRFDNAFILDKWKVRKWMSAQCNNSWAKCHKKLTVAQDYDAYIGKKSLWHVFRLYDYAIQILSEGKIFEYFSNDLVKLYSTIVKKEHSWNDLKEQYQSLRNGYASKLRTLVDKQK